ncbi:MAG: RecX family transcriptional regulator [Bacilli bacterium]|nr:RecX family transcriptional regulator [Bacilli bacterium]
MPSAKTGNAIVSISSDRRGQRSVVFADGTKLSLSGNAFTEMPLYVGKNVSPLEMRKLRSFLAREKLLNYALRLVSSREFSFKEMRGKLLAKSGDPVLVKEVLFDVREEGFLDDAAFAADYAASKASQLYGKERIVQTLRFEKGISPEIIAKLPFPEEAEHARSFLGTLERKMASFPLRRRKTKAAMTLRRRGFDEATVAMALASVKEDSAAVANALKKEAAKASRRYEKKYNGYDLRQKCFAYLHAKGFASAEIEAILEEML